MCPPNTQFARTFQGVPEHDDPKFALWQKEHPNGVQLTDQSPPAEDPAKAALDKLKPPPAPDLTDLAMREARRRQMRATASSQGRRSTFLTGPLGDASGVPKKSLLGGGY